MATITTVQFNGLIPSSNLGTISNIIRDNVYTLYVVPIANNVASLSVNWLSLRGSRGYHRAKVSNTGFMPHVPSYFEWDGRCLYTFLKKRVTVGLCTPFPSNIKYIAAFIEFNVPYAASSLKRSAKKFNTDYAFGSYGSLLIVLHNFSYIFNGLLYCLIRSVFKINANGRNA